VSGTKNPKSTSVTPTTQYAWTYDAAGQVDLASDNGAGIGSRDFDYDYDKLGRLKTNTFSTLIPTNGSGGTQTRNWEYNNVVSLRLRDQHQNDKFSRPSGRETVHSHTIPFHNR